MTELSTSRPGKYCKHYEAVRAATPNERRAEFDLSLPVSIILTGEIFGTENF